MKITVLELKIPHTNSADLPKQKLKKIYERSAFPIGRNRMTDDECQQSSVNKIFIPGLYVRNPQGRRRDEYLVIGISFSF